MKNIRKTFSLLLVFAMMLSMVHATPTLAVSRGVEKKAIRIATRDAHISPSKAYLLYTEDDYKGGRHCCKVSFYKKRGSKVYTHYVYYVSKTGTIIKSNSRDYHIISKDRAKHIALDDAGYSRSEVHDLSADLNEEHGKLVYNVSFTANKWDKHHKRHRDRTAIIIYDRRWRDIDYVDRDVEYRDRNIEYRDRTFNPGGYMCVPVGRHYYYYTYDYDCDDRDYDYTINAITEHIIDSDYD